MNTHYTYLLVNFGTILVPFIFSFHPKLQFSKQWKSLLPAIGIVALIFCFWDAYFTHLGVWSFNPKYIIGLYIGNLPIEEILFFISIPYACLFTYHCINLLYKIHFKKHAIFGHLLALILLSIGIFYFKHRYTSTTFISLSLILLILLFYKINILEKLFVIYGILLLPFFIVNGILTGTGLEQPVVSYNSSEIIGIRLLTIPIEDVFYGFELVLLNLSLFIYFQKEGADTSKT